MSITQQVNPNILNGMLAAGWNGSRGKPGGDNELIKGIPGNAIMKPTMNFPEATPPFGESFNGVRKFGTWWHFGQLFISDANYATYTGNNWSANFPAFKDLGGANLDNQKKVLKLYGAGTNFPDTVGSDKQNIDNERGLYNNYLPLVAFAETSPAAAFGSTSVWCKHGWCGTINVPNHVASITFGAYVKVPADDDFRDKNCGGMYLHQDTNAGPDVDAKIDAIIVKKSTDSMSLVTGALSQGADSIQQWSGMPSTFVRNGVPSARKNLNTDVRSITYENNTDYRQWKKIEKTVTFAGATTRIGFELFFGENQSNLDESGTPTGAILFYNPFVIFNDINGNPIPARKTGTITINHTGPGTNTVTVSTFENSAFTATYSESNPLVIPFDIDNFELFTIQVSPETVFSGSFYTLTGASAESGSIGAGGGSISCYWDGVQDVTMDTTSS